MTAKLSLLLAYPYFDDDNHRLLKSVPRDWFRLIVDSGAFSAWNSGKPIKLDDYCRFLDSLENLRPFHAVQLDVVGDGEATARNYEIMKERGYDVMPVFTRGDTATRLDDYYATTDYIMVGGIVAKEKNQNYVKWFCEQNKGRKAHWLGFVNIPFIKVYKPESVDSSAWFSGSVYGTMSLYRGKGELVQLARADLAKAPSPETRALFRGVGIEPGQFCHLAKDVTWSRPWGYDGRRWDKPAPGMVQFVSTLSHIRRSIEVEKRLGTKVYLACSNAKVNEMLFRAYEYLGERHLL